MTTTTAVVACAVVVVIRRLSVLVSKACATYLYVDLQTSCGMYLTCDCQVSSVREEPVRHSGGGARRQDRARIWASSSDRGSSF
jgi:hypothetical protein